MTPRYLPVAVVASQLRIGPRRLRTLLAEGRIDGAYRLGADGPSDPEDRLCGTMGWTGGRPWQYNHQSATRAWSGPLGSRRGAWLIPADYRVSPRTTGPQLRIYRKDGGS